MMLLKGVVTTQPTVRKQKESQRDVVCISKRSFHGTDRKQKVALTKFVERC